MTLTVDIPFSGKMPNLVFLKTWPAIIFMSIIFGATNDVLNVTWMPGMKSITKAKSPVEIVVLRINILSTIQTIWKSKKLTDNKFVHPATMLSRKQACDHQRSLPEYCAR